MDWRHAYQDHIRTATQQLRDARKTGAGVVSLASGVFDAVRMTDRDIDRVARRDAERVINMAIIQHNAEIDRRSRG